MFEEDLLDLPYLHTELFYSNRLAKYTWLLCCVELSRMQIPISGGTTVAAEIIVI